jgi:ketosteroid isomerase-like protein
MKSERPNPKGHIEIPQGLVLALLVACGAAPAFAGQAVAVRSNNELVSVMTAAQLAALSPALKEVVAANTAWADAYRTCDEKTMDRVMHENILFIHGHARVDTKPILMKNFACTTPREQAVIQPLRVVMIAPDTAVLQGAMTLGSPVQPITSLITRVFVREGGAWKIIAHQTTRNPGVDADGKPRPDTGYPQPVRQ